MPISPDNLARDIETIASFTEVDPAVGFSRPTFTPKWAAARDYVIAEAQKIGCAVRIDAAANVHLRPSQFPADQPLWLSGSHIDSVPTGGKFDGVMGIVCPLEVLRQNPAAPLELILFAEEEGSTFNLGMLGSRAWAGTLSADEMSKLKNLQGIDPITAGRPHGLDPSRLAVDRINPSHYRGLIEIHAEQGPAMWEQDERVAIVTAINGRRQFSVTITGEPNHAGSTPMNYRRDALVGAAEIIFEIENVPLILSPQTVLTVGQLNIKPNAINVIPGTATFTIDFRSPSDELLATGAAKIESIIRQTCQRRKLRLDLKQTESLPAVAMDEMVVGALRAAAARTGISVTETSSGALHDAAILAPLLPTAMVFVASKGGISHNPAEFSRIEDIAEAARLLEAVVTQ